MQKKEHYKHILPHFQQPGQAYFVTWSLNETVPPKAFKRYTDKLGFLKNQIRFYENSQMKNGSESTSPDDDKWLSTISIRENDSTSKCGMESASPGNRYTRLEELKREYFSVRKKYLKAYNDLLDLEKDPVVNLAKLQNTKVISNTLKFWEGKKIKNYAFCIMPNHIHWVLELLEKDEEGKPVYLQDIMYSVKRFSANKINKLEKRSGSLWQKESFDKTMRDDKHLYYSIEYTLNNPVNAGLVKDWRDWDGSWSREQGAADSTSQS